MGKRGVNANGTAEMEMEHGKKWQMMNAQGTVHTRKESYAYCHSFPTKIPKKISLTTKPFKLNLTSIGNKIQRKILAFF